MDYKEHLQEAGEGAYAIFENATDETRRALTAIHGFLEADFKAAETEIWQESQKGAANLAKIANLEAIKLFIHDFQDRLASIHLIDHAHDIQYNDDDGLYGPDLVPESRFGPDTTEDDLVTAMRELAAPVGGGDVVLPKGQKRQLAAQGVSFVPPPAEKVLPNDYDPNAGRRDIEPEDNLVAVQQAAKDAENPGKQSRAGETIRVDLGEGKVTVEHAGD